MANSDPALYFFIFAIFFVSVHNCQKKFFFSNQNLFSRVYNFLKSKKVQLCLLNFFCSLKEVATTHRTYFPTLVTCCRNNVLPSWYCPLLFGSLWAKKIRICTLVAFVTFQFFYQNPNQQSCPILIRSSVLL